ENRAKSESDLTGITPGQFKDFNEGNRILYVERLSADKRSMSNVFLQGRQAGHVGVLSADRAEIELDQKTGSRYVSFYAGRRYMGSPGRLDYSIVEYEKYGVRIDRSEAADRSARVSAASTASLWSANTPEAAAELQWRIAMPISTVLLTLLAVVLVRAASDQNRIVGLLSAVLIYFTYSNLLGIAKTLAKQGVVPVYLGLWWVHALLGLVILALLGYPLLRKRWARRQRAATLPRL
ncbi:MAG: LptF/LptG family permease, partial [Burkholderiales bacterium]